MDKYIIDKCIGEGSFGKVFKATDKATQNIVALKIIGKRSRSSRELKNFRKEVTIQKNLRHPNIILLLDSFETTCEIVVVTEFVGFGDLYHLLGRGGSLSETRAQKITFDLVSALYYLHSQRILHRDLKPQNILLDKNLSAKLCDFGLARSMTMSTHVLTSIKGTPLYMAPELLEGKPYDHEADLWSLGCIIFEMVAGEPPFCTTSILHLVRLIRHQYIKWPSFLSRVCISFLQGLLIKDSTQRMTWPQILCHPFVKGHIVILDECAQDSPFSLRTSQEKVKDEQTAQLKKGGKLIKKTKSEAPRNADDATSSRDSIKAILQSDIENLETDAEENIPTIDLQSTPCEQIELDFSDRPDLLEDPDAFVPVGQPLTNDNSNICFVSGNSNLMVQRFNDNFPQLNASVKQNIVISNESEHLSTDKELKGKINELEKRKLSQNTEPRSGEEVNLKKSVWNSDDAHSAPIENEEWLAFLHKSMQEILDGELDSLGQHNFVSIIVAPLRNARTSGKVMACIAQLLSLPLIMPDMPETLMEEVKRVYLEIKIIPNLIYSSKLICMAGPKSDSGELTTPSPQQMTDDSYAAVADEHIRTLSCVFELVCHLVHFGDCFLNQFCDAILILGINEMLVNFVVSVNKNEHNTRLVCNILALLGCALREMPENAELVENIVFDGRIDLTALMKNENELIRLRSCILLRLLGRYSCYSLKSVWKSSIRETIEALLYDSSADVRNEVESALLELKKLPFYDLA